MEIKFARSESVADAIMHLIHEASTSIDGALYRFNHPGLAQALEETAQRGVRVRLLVDGNKYKESRTTQELLTGVEQVHRGEVRRRRRLYRGDVLEDRLVRTIGPHHLVHQVHQRRKVAGGAVRAH